MPICKEILEIPDDHGNDVCSLVCILPKWHRGDHFANVKASEKRCSVIWENEYLPTGESQDLEREEI